MTERDVVKVPEESCDSWKDSSSLLYSLIVCERLKLEEIKFMKRSRALFIGLAVVSKGG